MRHGIALQPNGAAPAGMSRKRLKSSLEQARNGSTAPAGMPLSAESPEKPRAVPFHRPQAVKPLTTKEQVMGQTLRQAQKAEAAAVVVEERQARRAAKAIKFSNIVTSVPAEVSNRSPCRDSPASIAASSMDAAAVMPSIPSAAGKERALAAKEMPETQQDCGHAVLLAIWQARPLLQSIWTHRSRIHPVTGVREQLQNGCQHMMWTDHHEAYLATFKIVCCGWQCHLQGLRDLWTLPFTICVSVTML